MSNFSIEQLALESTTTEININPKDYFDPGEDANRIHIIDNHVIGFHVTTPKNAERILKEGPKESSNRVGYAGREMPTAFWLNCVPWIPYSIEQYHSVFNESDMTVLACLLDAETSMHRIILEPTWYWIQWAARADEIKNIVPVAPEMFWLFRSKKAATTLKGYLKKEIPNCGIQPDWYAARLLQHNNARNTPRF